VRVVFEMYDADVFPDEPFRYGKLRGNQYMCVRKVEVQVRKKGKVQSFLGTSVHRLGPDAMI